MAAPDDAGDGLEATLAAGWEAYRSADPARGQALAEAALARDPEHGPAWYLLAACQERAGRPGEADRSFRRASRAAHEPQEPPFRVSWTRFEALVAEARAALPARLLAAIDEVTLVLADYADPDLLADHEDAELLGLFVGQTRADRSALGEQPLPTPCIHVFRRAHEHHCASQEEFAEEVRRTLYHEFGHYLGYDEDDLDQLGMG